MQLDVSSCYHMYLCAGGLGPHPAMQPPTLLGAIAGSYINKLLPVWISHVLLAVLLTLMTLRVMQRARRIYRRETAARCLAGHTSSPTAAATPITAAVPSITAAAPAAVQTAEHRLGPSFAPGQVRTNLHR